MMLTNKSIRLNLLMLLLSLVVACQAHTTLPTHVTQLQSIDETIGQGRKAENGVTVSVHYSGWLYDALASDGKGKSFDSSYARHEPLRFTIGNQQVIQGWEEGIIGMQVGGKRLLRIPSALAYGARGAGKVIPPHADLTFEVELLAIE